MIEGAPDIVSFLKQEALILKSGGGDYSRKGWYLGWPSPGQN